MVLWAGWRRPCCISSKRRDAASPLRSGQHQGIFELHDLANAVSIEDLEARELSGLLGEIKLAGLGDEVLEAFQGRVSFVSILLKNLATSSARATIESRYRVL